MCNTRRPAAFAICVRLPYNIGTRDGSTASSHWGQMSAFAAENVHRPVRLPSENLQDFQKISISLSAVKKLSGLGGSKEPEFF